MDDILFKHIGPITAGKWHDKRHVLYLSTLFRDEKRH